MGTFFLLYLVFAIENIASFLEAFYAIGGLILSGAVVLCIILGIAYSDTSSGYDSYREYIQPYKRTIKNLVIFGVVFLTVGSTGRLLPSQKDMILIASGTAAYQAITSEAGQELTGAAYEALMRKLDSVAQEENIPKPTGE